MKKFLLMGVALALGAGVAQAGHYEKQVRKNTNAIKQHETRLNATEAGMIADRGRISDNAFDITMNQLATQSNKLAIQSNAAAIATNSSRIDILEDDVEQVRAGVAMAVAIANAPLVFTGEKGISLSGGLGYFEEKTAGAFKAGYNPTANTALSLSVATDFEDNFAAGAGFGLGF